MSISGYPCFLSRAFVRVRHIGIIGAFDSIVKVRAFLRSILSIGGQTSKENFSLRGNAGM